MTKTNLLILGSRKGLNRALKNLNISHTVCKDYKNDPPNDSEVFTHVLASGEGTVALANSVRKDLGIDAIEDRVITLCSDKLEMKTEAKSKDIPVTKFLPGNTSLSSDEIYQRLGPKVVVKEKNNSGGKGQKVYKAPEEIFSTENDLIEGFVTGREMSVESFIENGKIKFTSTTQYLEIGVINIVPGDVSEEVLKEVLKINEKVIKAFGIKFGLTHLEVYLTENGVLFGEIALRPPGGYIMTLMEKAHGINPWETYIKLHLNEPVSLNKVHRLHAGAIVYHPGVGVIQKIEGENNLENLKTLVDYKIKGKVGEKVSPRNGVGQEQAHFIFNHEDRDLLVQEIVETRRTFKMDV